MSKRTDNKSNDVFSESKSGGMSKGVCSKEYVRDMSKVVALFESDVCPRVSPSEYV